MKSENEIINYRVNKRIEDLMYLSSELESEGFKEEELNVITNRWRFFADNMRSYEKIRT